VSINDHFVLGDAMSSVSVLKFADSKLHMVARDYGPLWPVCVQALDKKSIIGANVSGLIYLARSLLMHIRLT
jgi:DNA damage-binding protein 1